MSQHAAAAGPAAPGRFAGLDERFIPPLFITLILVVGQWSYGILESLEKTLVAIATAIVVELLLSRVYRGRWPHPASAYITGISVGILIRSPDMWPFVLASALSIGSKYVLRIHDRHLWNPSNFGVCALLFLAPYSVASLSVQWGNNLYPMLVVWILGLVIVSRVRRVHITLTYVASFVFFGLLRSAVTGDPWLSEIAPLTGAMYQLFIFFMITDPRTTVRSSVGAQAFVAFLVALVEFGLRLLEVVNAPFYALFLVGPAAMLVEMWLQSRRASTAAAPVSV